MLTAEGGAAHLGTLMTQFAILYALARRSKYHPHKDNDAIIYTPEGCTIILTIAIIIIHATPAICCNITDNDSRKIWTTDCFSAKRTVAQMIKDEKSGTADTLFFPTRSKLPLLRISPMLNFHLYLISRLSSHFYRLPKSKKPNLQSCGVDFQSVGLDDYERDRKSDRQAWRRDKYCETQPPASIG